MMSTKLALIILLSLLPYSCQFQLSLTGLRAQSRFGTLTNFPTRVRMQAHTDDKLLSSSFSRRTILITKLPGLIASSTLISNPSYTLASEEVPIANFALRRAGALPPSITNLAPSKLGLFVRFGESLLYSDDASRTPGKDIYASFDYPSDWLQLDRILGGVQFVDQRNGDKVYILKVKLPKGIDRLSDVPKTYIGDAVFNPRGDLVRTGNVVEDYKVLSSKIVVNERGENEGSDGLDQNMIVPRRRFNVRYTTVTGNNFSVERKGLIDAYEVGGMIYMLMTGSNSVLFEKKGREYETINYIADSFRVIPQ